MKFYLMITTSLNMYPKIIFITEDIYINSQIKGAEDKLHFVFKATGNGQHIL